MLSNNNTPDEPAEGGKRCPRCGEPLLPGPGPCPGCGFSGSEADGLDSVDDFIDGLSNPDDLFRQEPRPEPREIGDEPTTGPPTAPPAGAGEGGEDLGDVDDLLDKIADPDALFENPAEAPPHGAPSVPTEEKPPPTPPPAPSGTAPSPPPLPPEDEEEEEQKVRRITMVERKRRDTARRTRLRVQCAHCKQVFDPSKLPGTIEKCLNCGSRNLKYLESPLDEDIPPLPEEEAAEEAEERESEEEAPPEAAAEEGDGAAPEEEMPAPEAPVSEADPIEGTALAPEADLLTKRTGHKDYYREFMEEENIYAAEDIERAAEAGGQGEEGGGGEGKGWGAALMGDLEIKKRADEEAVLKDDYFLGKRVKDYLILEIIGRGGMGTVYKARKDDGQMVAMKILPPLFARDEAKVDRFLKEAASASKLDHPNIVKCYDFGQDGDVHFIAMELVVGKSVGDLIKEKRAVKIEESLRIIKSAARGLAAAHEKGIIHRDMKPDNIMINRNGVIQVADFGLARDVQASSSLSGSGEIVGTPYYISPEQIDCQDVDAKADLYSLGATIYHLITGKRPFEGSTPMEVLLKHMNEKLVPPVDRNPLIPVTVSRLISKMMEKNREFRYQDCEELVSDIDLIEKGETPDIVLEEETEPRRKAPVPKIKKPRSKAWWVLLWFVVIAGAAVGLRFAVLQPLDTTGFFPPDPGVHKEAAEALGEAEIYLKTHPDDPGASREKMEAVVERFPETKEADQARKHLEALESALAEEVSDWVRERAATAKALQEGGLLGRALLEVRKPVPARLAGRPELDALDEIGKTLARALADRDGMVLVPGGEVSVPSPGGDERARAVAPFLMSITEVTNRAYQAFVDIEGYHTKSFWDAEGWKAREAFRDRTGKPGPAFWSEGRFPPGKADHPVVGISWYEARAFARFRDMRLPTEAEWQQAAAGPAGRAYPFGASFDPSKAVGRHAESGTVPADSLGAGATPLGLLHMAGNVHEWTASSGKEAGRTVLVRGGGFDSHPFNLRTDSRVAVRKTTRDEALGFRLARDP